MTTKSVDLAHLRSVVLAGHSGSGKTTLAENLLFKTGAIARLGKVDDGTAALDYEPEEHRRKESLSAAPAKCLDCRRSRAPGTAASTFAQAASTASPSLDTFWNEPNVTYALVSAGKGSTGISSAGAL